MVGAFLDCVPIGRGGGICPAGCKVDVAGELSEFIRRPSGFDEATEGFTLLDVAKVLADLLEVRGL
jgi:hypothetical protein